MPQYIITPWKYHSELLQVRRELYQLGLSAAPADDRRHAVDWVGAWKMRGNLPHAVECTAQLVDAILHHDATKNSMFSIRAAYSAAFCRFVTGFCDIEQNTGHKRNMYEVAEVLNMPASFVELRHEATHEELPSLLRLSRNTELALDWLWHHFWGKIEDPSASVQAKKTQNLLNPPDLTMIDGSQRVILATFMAKRRQEIKRSVNDFSHSSASGIACQELVKVCRGSKDYLKTLASILVEEKMLVPAGRSHGSSMEGAFAIWGNLLRRLSVHQKRFLEILLGRMSYIVAQTSQLALQLDAFREAVSIWILHIFTSDPWTQPRTKDLVSQLRGMIVNDCIMDPNCWSTPLARKLIDGGSMEFKEQWTPLVRLIEKG